MTFPAVPLGDQFQHPTNPRSVLETAADLHPKVDTNLNALRSYMLGQPGSNLAQLRLSHRSAGATAIAASATIKFDTTLADTAGGWNVATGLYTVPAAGGLFLLTAVATLATAASFRLYISGIPVAVFASGNINGCAVQNIGRSSRVRMMPVRFTGGEQIGARVTAAISIEGITTAGSDKNRFEAIQVGW
jgi:hypothetical protein